MSPAVTALLEADTRAKGGAFHRVELGRGTFTVSGNLHKCDRSCPDDDFTVTVGPFAEVPKRFHKLDLVAPVKGKCGDLDVEGLFAYILRPNDEHAELDLGRAFDRHYCYVDACNAICMAIDDHPAWAKLRETYLADNEELDESIRARAGVFDDYTEIACELGCVRPGLALYARITGNKGVFVMQGGQAGLASCFWRKRRPSGVWVAHNNGVYDKSDALSMASNPSYDPGAAE